MNKENRHGNGPTPAADRRNLRRIHHSPLFWIGVVLFLAAIAIYVLSDDLSWRPRVHNSALGLNTPEAESVGLPPFREGIEFPNPDFAALARACGGHGVSAGKPGDLQAAIGDAVVVANELPKLPHLELEMIGQVALAKAKEARLAITGG